MRKPTPLKRAIFETGRPQRHVADALNIDETYFSRICNGLIPLPELRLRIADELGVKTSALWPFDSDDGPAERLAEDDEAAA